MCFGYNDGLASEPTRFTATRLTMIAASSRACVAGKTWLLPSLDGARKVSGKKFNDQVAPQILRECLLRRRTDTGHRPRQLIGRRLGAT